MTLSNPAQYISGRTVQEQMNSLIDYVDQRAADVALDAIASDVAQVHQDMLDADADAAAAAASAAAAAGTLANAVKKTGESSQSIAGDIAVGGDLSAGGDLSVTGDAGVQGQLSVLGGCDLRAPVKIPVTPTNNDDAASKKYVDDSLDNYAPMVRTTGNQLNIAGDKGFLNSLTALPRNIFNALGWTNIFNINATGVYVFMMFAGSNVLLCQLDGHSAARALVIGNTARPYADCIKIAHNQITDEYEVWFNAAYGAWARGFMISEGSAQSVGEPSHYVAKNIRSVEPVIGDTYDSIVTSVRWNVVP